MSSPPKHEFMSCPLSVVAPCLSQIDQWSKHTNPCPSDTSGCYSGGGWTDGWSFSIWYPPTLFLVLYRYLYYYGLSTFSLPVKSNRMLPAILHTNEYPTSCLFLGSSLTNTTHTLTWQRNNNGNYSLCKLIAILHGNAKFVNVIFVSGAKHIHINVWSLLSLLGSIPQESRETLKEYRRIKHANYCRGREEYPQSLLSI